MAKWRVFPDEEPAKPVLVLADQVERDGGSVLAIYREPVGDHWQMSCRPGPGSTGRPMATTGARC